MKSSKMMWLVFLVMLSNFLSLLDNLALTLFKAGQESVTIFRIHVVLVTGP